MRYQDNVRAAAAALDINAELEAEVVDYEFEQAGDQAKWRRCERVHRCTLDKGDPLAGRSSGKLSMAEWCRQVSLRTGDVYSEFRGRTYKAVWEKYGHRPDNDRPKWSDAYAEIRGGTVGERMVEADFKRALANATPEQKREQFTTLAREPEVVSDSVASTTVFKEITRSNPAAVEQAWQDTDTNIALSTARWKARDDILEPTRRAHEDTKEIFEPKDTTLDRTNFFYGIQKRVEQWAFELKSIREFLERTDDVNTITRWSTRKALEDLIRAATECRDRLPASYVEAQADDVVTTVTRRERLA